MNRLFPSRLVIPATASNPEMQALYDTRNRREQILLAQKKGTEGYSINDIALLLHFATTTIQKYLSISEEELSTQKKNVRERQYIQAMADKQMVINEVRKLYSEGYAIDEITHLTGHAYQTVIKYLKEDCFTGNNHYAIRMPGSKR